MTKLWLGFKFFWLDLARDLIRWPFWWYSRGLVLFFEWSREFLVGYAATLGVGVWIKNLFVPMFGQRDWQSRIISFFMRLFQIAFRSVALAILAFGVFLAGIVYLVAPLAVVAGLFFQLFGSVA